MNRCKLCGSYAVNPGQNGRKDDNPDLCDVHYFIAQRDELLAALKKQASQCNQELRMIRREQKRRRKDKGDSK